MVSRSDFELMYRGNPLVVSVVAFVAIIICLGGTLLPNLVTGFHFSVLVALYLVLVSVVSHYTSTIPVKFLVGAVTGFVTVVLMRCFLNYDIWTDSLFWRPYSLPENTIGLSIPGVMFFFAPVYHSLRIQKHLQPPSPEGTLLWVQGLRLGFKQSLVVAVLVSPFLYLLVPTASRINAPPDVRQGPTEQGRLEFTGTLATSILVAGTVIGGLTPKLAGARYGTRETDDRS